MHDTFTEISGDDNILHMNEEYAKEQGFSGRVVYGMLSSALYSKLVGVYLPGKYCLLQEIDITFRKPVYINDKLTVKGKVVEKNDLFKRIVVKAEIRNENNEKISSAKIKVGVVK
jgi:3-hydroxybutyryl-CoA dehydratase